MTRDSPDEERVKVRMESEVKLEIVTDATRAVSGALHPKAESASKSLKIGTSEYCFVKQTSVNKFEDLHGLRTGFVFFHNMNLVLGSLPYFTCGARAQTSSADDAFYREVVASELRFVGRLVASGAHERIFIQFNVLQMKQKPPSTH